MPGKVLIVWDYDGAIGQVNASYPYNFQERKIIEEIENVETIIKLASEFDIKMTFACVGFAAEPGTYPYHVPEQIRKLFASGHEIASHSWRHEWFPYLQEEQIRRSLRRSKSILEECVGSPGAVEGFVPPFSRPMSWYGRGALSLGDRAVGPWYPGASYGTLLPLVRAEGYKWCRVTYYPIWQKLRQNARKTSIRDLWPPAAGVHCVPNHYTGFDEPAISLVRRVTEDETAAAVISGHPSGLTRSKSENLGHLRLLLSSIANHRHAGKLDMVTISSFLSSRKESYHGPVTDPAAEA